MTLGLYNVTTVMEKMGGFLENNDIQVYTSLIVAYSEAEAKGIVIANSMKRNPMHKLASVNCYEVSQAARDFAAGRLIKSHNPEIMP